MKFCLLDGTHGCKYPQICQFDRAKWELRARCPRETLGQLVSRSLTRSRRCSEVETTYGSYEVEMDWALFRVDQWPNPLPFHIWKQRSNLQSQKVVPGASIKVSARTSGLDQIGLINTAACSVHQGAGRFTREWTVLRDPSTTREDWIMGGIGVDGDSGAWIIDREERSVYGMAWGRHQFRAESWCLFTPMEHIITDIKERTGAQDVRLLTSESTPVSSGKDKIPAFETSTALLTVTMKSQPDPDISMEQEVLEVSSSNVR